MRSAESSINITAVDFPETVSAGAIYATGGVTQTTQSHVYTFTPADTFTATVVVTAATTSGLAATAPFAVVSDTVAPAELEVTAPQRVTTTSIPVSWGATDAGAGLDH